VLETDILDVAQPIVNEPKVPIEQRCHDPAASVVAHDEYVLNLQDVHGILENRETVQVGMDDDVADIAVDEDFTGN
jgi:hypothetical protein